MTSHKDDIARENANSVQGQHTDFTHNVDLTEQAPPTVDTSSTPQHDTQEHDPQQQGNTSPADPAPDKPAVPLVIGIGASAGGLSPLQDFFDNMPADCQAAFVVVQHLSPDFKSVMQELLRRHTRMNVIRVEDNMLMEAGSVYLIPPTKNMVIADGRLRLLDQDLSEGHPLNFPIDLFFKSLADNLGERSAAIVLSGTGTDGTRGVREVHEAGGLVLVQEPASSQFDGMPRSALATKCVDYTLPPAELAKTIYECVRQSILTNQDSIVPHALNEEDLSTLGEMLEVVKGHSGTDFSHYKPGTIARRIERRMLISGQQTQENYLDLLKESAEERDLLHNDLLIKVTNFFRDLDAWQQLSHVVLPDLIASTSESEPLRLWVTACSTGQEVYSLAMTVLEALEDSRKPLDVKIFATDIDKTVLEFASNGVYPESIVQDISPERLSRFFVKKGNFFHATRELRRMAIFAQHDLTKDAPFTRMHLATCRNVLIYMQPNLQKQVLANLHFSLKTSGYLFLGAAEGVSGLENEFHTISRKWKIYQKRRDVLLPLSRHSSPGGDTIELVSDKSRSTATMPRNARPESLICQAFGHMLKHRSAAGLLLNNAGEIMYTFGNARGFLTIPEGQPSDDVCSMLPREIALPLNTGMQRAKTSSQPVVYNAIGVRMGVENVNVNLEIHHFDESRMAPEHYLVMLEQRQAVDNDGESDTFDASAEATQRINDLEQELRYSRENLQATIEELETSNEEQQATNEELLASNEQLQSTNEELHSVNEELYTVNAEYQAKIQELTDLNNDMDNLLRSTDIGTVFLDSQLRIRKFTPAAQRVMNLIESDIGRPIQHLSYNFEYATLLDDVRQALETGESIERDASIRSEMDVLVRIHPYRSEMGETEGVVLTFVDISELKRVQQQLQYAHDTLDHKVNIRTSELARVNESLSQLAAIVESSQDAIIAKTLDGLITTWNPGAERLYGYTTEEAIGKHISMLQPPDKPNDLPWIMDKLRAGETVSFYETQRRHKSGQLIDVSLTISPIRDENGEVTSAATIARDITEHRRADDLLRRQSDELEAANADLQQKNEDMEQFVYSASHDLKSPLVSITGLLGMLKKRLSEDNNDSELIDIVQRTEKTALRMRQGINDLLELSRIGQVRHKIEMVDLNAVINQTITRQSERITSAGIDVRYDHNLATIFGDHDRLTQLFSNLLDNAIIYGCNGDNKTVEITGHQQDDQVLVCVRDNGPGIDPQYHERIFRVFHRIDEHHEGTGVGLAIVKRIAEQHKGRVWIESNCNQGAAFWVALPKQQEPVQ